MKVLDADSLWLTFYGYTFCSRIITAQLTPRRFLQQNLALWRTAGAQYEKIKSFENKISRFSQKGVVPSRLSCVKQLGLIDFQNTFMIFNDNTNCGNERGSLQHLAIAYNSVYISRHIPDNSEYISRSYQYDLG